MKIVLKQISKQFVKKIRAHMQNISQSIQLEKIRDLLLKGAMTFEKTIGNQKVSNTFLCLYVIAYLFMMAVTVISQPLVQVIYLPWDLSTTVFRFLTVPGLQDSGLANTLIAMTA